MKKTENQRAERSEGIANRQTAQSLRGTIRLLISVDDNTIEDTTRQELDHMLKEYGYN